MGTHIGRIGVLIHTERIPLARKGIEALHNPVDPCVEKTRLIVEVLEVDVAFKVMLGGRSVTRERVAGEETHESREGVDNASLELRAGAVDNGLRIQEMETKGIDRVMVEDVIEKRRDGNLGAGLGASGGIGLGTSWVPNERQDDEDDEYPEGIGADVLDPAGLRDQRDLRSKLMVMD
ncbi:hypothetical protein DFH07DRAFT_767163 [Mycena maculata]|uniref:Uncharacterized protein n=1 Tax=Mycena maculata TaxID=230809 RepID=A0AAD7NUY9_9AGAR|nr:hypothetical protein DFH07DRAFT_767163 [Mycena maculata]